MEQIKKTKYGFKVLSSFFNATDTLQCGQVFRFYYDDGGYIVVSGDKKCLIKSNCIDNISNDNLAKSEYPCYLTTIITNDPDYFYNYFDLATDYQAIQKDLSKFEELSDCLSQGRGIHILRQQLFEAIISFMISANNNIPRIKSTIEKICAKYGTRMQGYYAFPSPLQLKDVKEQDFKALGAGYRAEYLQNTVHKILNSDILSILPTLAYKDSLKLLLSLKGVGQKVADCISLFALGHAECYPADVWIRKAEGGLSAKESVKKGINRYNALAGYAQQYKFYYHIASKKQVTKD